MNLRAKADQIQMVEMFKKFAKCGSANFFSQDKGAKLIWEKN